MKQTWMIFLLVILTALPALAATITVKTPADGATLQVGVTNSITWTYDGLPDATKVMIVLWHNGSKLGIIAQDLGIGSNGQGSYNWNAGTYAGGPAAATSGYSVKVRTMDNSASGVSGSFSLSPKTITIPPQFKIDPGKLNPNKNIEVKPVYAMDITNPKAGYAMSPFTQLTVQWTKLGALDANVSVQLLRKVKGFRSSAVTLAPSTPNSGGFNWDPTALAPEPGTYSIKVRTLDGKCEAVSGEFTMKEWGVIEPLSPKGGEVWENGSSHAVTWKHTGNIQKVDILLYRSSSAYKTLAQGLDAKLGTKNCVFERDPYDQGNQCKYTLFIATHSGVGIGEDSGCFTITGNPDLAVSASWSPILANAGTNLTFAIKIENKGVVRSQPCQGDFYVNGAIDQSFPVPAIDPGASVSVSRIWKLACPGTVKIIIDPGQVNVDTDKANNTWEKLLCTN